MKIDQIDHKCFTVRQIMILSSSGLINENSDGGKWHGLKYLILSNVLQLAWA